MRTAGRGRDEQCARSARTEARRPPHLTVDLPATANEQWEPAHRAQVGYVVEFRVDGPRIHDHSAPYRRDPRGPTAVAVIENHERTRDWPSRPVIGLGQSRDLPDRRIISPVLVTGRSCGRGLSMAAVMAAR